MIASHERRLFRATLAAPLVVAALALATSGCPERAVGASHDGGPDAAPRPDTGAPPDGAVPPDGAAPCEAPRLAMGFVVDTAVSPTHPIPSVSDYALEGNAVYHGPLTEPIATNPAFAWEVQIGHGDGSLSIVQYYLPVDPATGRELRLPVTEGFPHGILFRRRQGFEGESVGVVVTRPTSGLPPLLFVGDAGPFERAFEPEDPVMAPLKVAVEAGPDCPPVTDPDCGGERILDQLRFDSSTGGQITAVSVPQSRADTLPVFGDPFRVVTLASSHADPPCLDFNPVDVSYLAVSIAALPR